MKRLFIETLRHWRLLQLHEAPFIANSKTVKRRWESVSAVDIINILKSETKRADPNQMRTGHSVHFPYNCFFLWQRRMRLCLCRRDRLGWWKRLVTGETLKGTPYRWPSQCHEYCRCRRKTLLNRKSRQNVCCPVLDLLPECYQNNQFVCCPLVKDSQVEPESVS